MFFFVVLFASTCYQYITELSACLMSLPLRGISAFSVHRHRGNLCAGRPRGLDALLFALDYAASDVTDGQRWYVPVGCLQTVCSELLLACRERHLVTSHLKLHEHHLDCYCRLWRLRQATARRSATMRVLPIPVRAITWTVSAQYLPRRTAHSVNPGPGENAANRESSRQTSWLAQEVERMWRSGSLRQLELYCKLDETTDDVVLPAMLHRLSLETTSTSQSRTYSGRTRCIG